MSVLDTDLDDGTGPLILPRTRPTPVVAPPAARPARGRHRRPTPHRGPGLAESAIVIAALIALVLVIYAMSAVT